MDDAKLRDALSAIAAAANDGLAALSEPAETIVVEPPELPDYHQQDLERIEAETAAQVAVIEAEAAAAVEVISAQAANAPDPVSPEPIETIDDALVDEPLADNPLMDETVTPADEPGDLADADEAIEEAGDVLDALPVIEPEAVADVAPIPQHWYTRKRFGRK